MIHNDIMKRLTKGFLSRYEKENNFMEFLESTLPGLRRKI